MSNCSTTRRNYVRELVISRNIKSRPRTRPFNLERHYAMLPTYPPLSVFLPIGTARVTQGFLLPGGVLLGFCFFLFCPWLLGRWWTLDIWLSGLGPFSTLPQCHPLKGSGPARVHLHLLNNNECSQLHPP